MVICDETSWSLRLGPLQWRHNERDDVSNHQHRDCLLYSLFRRRSKKTSKLRVTGLCAGNSQVTGEFSAQRVNNQVTRKMFPFDDISMQTDGWTQTETDGQTKALEAKNNMIVVNIGEFKIQKFSLKKMHLKMSSWKWEPLCLGLNVLMEPPLARWHRAKWPTFRRRRFVHENLWTSANISSKYIP